MNETVLNRKEERQFVMKKISTFVLSNNIVNIKETIENKLLYLANILQDTYPLQQHKYRINKKDKLTNDIVVVLDEIKGDIIVNIK